MNKKILFSPVGGTDPISENNCHDGSLLHICRIYMPDEIILYMSQEIIKNQEKDNRYKRALNMLFEKQGREGVVIKEIKRPELSNVEKYDYFYNDFQDIIEEIRSHMDETDTLILNVSSGTPAMKSGLLIIQNYSERHAKVVQVITPERKMNEHTHGDTYDLDRLWESDKDNEEGAENRCVEISCPSLTRIKNEETIKKLILAYDYKAALVVADTLPEKATSDYYGLIQMAYFRTLLDAKHVNEMICQTGYNCLLIQDYEKRNNFEYALNCFLKYKKGLYSDFVLSLTPIIVNIFSLILKKQVGFDLEEYTSEKSSGQRHWDKNKLKNTKYQTVLEDHYSSGRGFRYENVYSDNLNVLIQKLCGNDKSLTGKCRKIRWIEDKIRNVIAHQIVMVDEDDISNKTGGVTCQEIIRLIKSLFDYTDISIKDADWDSYEQLNEEIIRRMS